MLNQFVLGQLLAAQALRQRLDVRRREIEASLTGVLRIDAKRSLLTAARLACIANGVDLGAYLAEFEADLGRDEAAHKNHFAGLYAQLGRAAFAAPAAR